MSDLFSHLKSYCNPVDNSLSNRGVLCQASNPSSKGPNSKANSQFVHSRAAVEKCRRAVVHNDADSGVQPQLHFVVQMAFVEIYNEGVRDILSVLHSNSGSGDVPSTLSVSEAA